MPDDEDDNYKLMRVMHAQYRDISTADMVEENDRKRLAHEKLSNPALLQPTKKSLYRKIKHWWLNKVHRFYLRRAVRQIEKERGL